MKEMINRELCAKIIEVVSCTPQSGYVRDYETEAQLWDDIKREEKGFGAHSYYYCKDRYKERLFMHSGFDSYIKEDEITGEPVLMSYRMWYDYNLRISYVLEGRTINTEVSCSSDYKDLHIGDSLYVTVNNSNSEKVLSVSSQSEKESFLLGLLLVGMAVFVVLLIAIYALIGKM